MSLNWKEIACILSELPLAGSHVQKIEQPDFSSLILRCYAPGNRFALLVALSQGRTRLHLLTEKRKQEVGLQRFAQFLRSRINGGKIVEAKQIGRERIVEITILRGGETTRLFVRLWGGAGNIIACDEDGVILDAFYRRPAKKEMSGERYRPEDLIARSGTQKSERSFEVRSYPATEGPYPFNRYIEAVYHEQEIGEERLRLQKRAKAILDKRIIHYGNAVRSLEKQMTESASSERLREYGDLLMSNIHLIEEGAEKFVCSSFADPDITIEIPLDPTCSPSENGTRYYQRYKKEKTKRGFLEQDLASARRELIRYEEFSRKLSAELPDEEVIEFLNDFLRGEKSRNSKEAEREAPGSGLRFFSGIFTLLVGRSAKENDQLLRTSVRGNDYWLHARDFPGAYVFIKNMPGKSIPLDVLLDAGNLALFFSQGKNGGKGELYYTQVKYLRRAKHGKTGLVIPTREKNLSVVLDQGRLDRLLGKEKEP
ncbi:NFACT RNA binding domain-containing protein [Sediminispirochaeta smaragdinae]|uniref:Fibronectin-binding A domain protein n=1 Tax=Sediminispirochaeta smaragdinae (strain DSM 11293 / JCM 15392 / SEBR 4228) TaxID=573413 RepID=E1R762_SEDSS|nr:NFACT family protein [Sediminispirochaeta smaragdinae]ADK81389.1 Fibronectin-binding A domain protein [Sediminispirochaeta smaragdinae DSM 11293]